ncbi:phage protein NinX family protein [Burkholderia multivorans]|uniref:phage protein NinX family protein n=1 Tax=Burkholderia multivorans TaxID=87883 RepID=UPI001C22E760|nr:phage protein NinX family protein [Burkholderia multivorans]ULR75110.1 hypothetical protein JC1_38 [Burkholderia phage JC1]MBU9386624.1 DUF2591 domain-containing protein [Burkholderia multivorans]MBU9437058.1 DUF2591 domain-containing protein [Burkholderia multivorans]MBU9606263.1 DUF2591 domain-containing protein [Burkholderia multivorans]MBU9624822.1 DUF2591 domain-containing protein [Burkholderia multivorans]
MKVSELTGAQLDYWVARAEGKVSDYTEWLRGYASFWRPSNTWSVAGPIIERERINIVDRAAYLASQGRPKEAGEGKFAALIGSPEQLVQSYFSEYTGLEFEACQLGPTPLVAAMRAYVASKFGEEVPE